MEKERQVTQTYTVCDFCGTELSCSTPCAICGKDVCPEHEKDWCEDGSLCPDCAKTHRMETEDGCVAVIDRASGKAVNAPHL